MKQGKKVLVIVSILLMLLFNFASILDVPFFPTVYALPDVSSYFWNNKVSIPLPSGVTISTWDIAETSYGIFVASDGGKIYRTTDDGQSWDNVYNFTYSVGAVRCMQTVENWVLVRWSHSSNNIVVCKDGVGDTWQLSTASVPVLIRDMLIQAPNGTFYAAVNMRSDDGIDWTTWFNISEVMNDLGLSGYEHGHSMAYDPLREVFYVAIGDTLTGQSWAGSGKCIIYMTNDGVWHGLDPNKGAGVGNVVTPEGVIWGMDHACVDLHKSWYGNDTYLYLQDAHGLYTYISHLAINNEVVYVATGSSTATTIGVYASPDYGRNWITIVEESSTTDDYYVGSGSTADSILVWKASGGTQELWRLYNPDPEELLHYINQDYVSISNSTYTFVKDVGNNTNSVEYNGTEYIDASSCSITGASIKFTGVSYKNHWNNTSFEDGTTDWSFTGTGSYGTTTTQAKYGSYSVELNKTDSGVFDFHPSQGGSVPVLSNEKYTVSVWVRTNVTTSGYLIYFMNRQKNSTGSYTGWQQAAYVGPSTGNTWTRKSTVITTNRLNDVDGLIFKLRIQPMTGQNVTWHIDAFLLDHCNLARPEKEHSHYNLVDWFEGTLNTTNPSVTIAGQTISHSGELTDGEETTPTSLTSLPSTGVIEVSDIHVEESGIVKITATATVEFEVTNLYLREKSGAVYIGRRYNDTITVPTSISSLICISDGKSNISTTSLTDRLTFAVSAWTGQDSNTMVYCGSKGQPSAYGATISAYNTTTTICTLAVTHSSDKQIILDWNWDDTLPSDGDAWTENDNATYTWKCHSSYRDTMGWSTDAQVGTYSVNVTHTKAATGMYFRVLLDTTYDVMGYDGIYFWIKVTSPDSDFDVSMVAHSIDTNWNVANDLDMWYSGGVDVFNATWQRCYVNLWDFEQTGAASWSSIRQLYFVVGGVGSADGTEVLIDGLHFGMLSLDAMTSPTAASYQTLMANVWHNFKESQYTETYDGTDYTTQYDWQNLTDNSWSGGGLEAEVLGHSIYALSIAYNYTGYTFYLTEAETLAEFLLTGQIHNGIFDGMFSNFYTGVAWSVNIGSVTNGWVMAGLSLLYSQTSNVTYKTALDSMRNAMCGVNWNTTYNVMNNGGNNSTQTVSYATGLGAMKDGACLAGLSLYYKYVETNSTVLDRMEKLETSLTATVGYFIRQRMFDNKYEDNAYSIAGAYWCQSATSNNTHILDYRDAMHKVTEKMTIAPGLNGSAIRNIGVLSWQLYPSPSDYLDGWGLHFFLHLLYLANEFEADSVWINALERSLFIHLYETQDDDGGFQRNSEPDGLYWDLQYCGTPAFLHLALQLYHLQKATDLYVLGSTALVSSVSSTSTSLSFTLTDDVASTTYVYCGSNGEPVSVTGASWSYNSTTTILTVLASHSSAQDVVISWEEEDDGDGDHSPPQPPVSYHTLTVHVLYENGTTIPHLRVTLLGYGSYYWYGITDLNGTCIFRNVVEGQYSVSVEEKTQTVNVPYDKSVTFMFESEWTPAEPWLSAFLRENWPPLLLIGCCIILLVVVVKRRR